MWHRTNLCNNIAPRLRVCNVNDTGLASGEPGEAKARFDVGNLPISQKNYEISLNKMKKFHLPPPKKEKKVCTKK